MDQLLRANKAATSKAASDGRGQAKSDDRCDSCNQSDDDDDDDDEELDDENQEEEEAEEVSKYWGYARGLLLLRALCVLHGFLQLSL